MLLMIPRLTLVCNLVSTLLTMGMLVIARTASSQVDSGSETDLIEGLNIHNTSYEGLSLVTGFPRHSPALHLTGDSRHIQLPSAVCHEVGHLLSQTNEFTFLANVKQDERNSGSILSFSEGNNRVLELQSSGRKDEIRFHYRHNNATYTEAFTYKLADKSWHQLALSISGTHVDLYIDCNRVYRRTILTMDRDLNKHNLTLWLGQRNVNHFLFRGYLQNIKIVTKAHGFLVQCPHLETECPTCGQFKSIQSAVYELETVVKALQEKLIAAENRLQVVEECECFKSCHINGSVHPDGATWKQDCDICSCVHGEVTCRPVRCPRALCKNPELVSGECCPICKKQCLISGRVLEHGEKISRYCLTCICNDGTVTCKRIDPETMCPPLQCAPHEQFGKEGECCQFCPGIDYCGQGHDCHPSASCHNLKTEFACQCNPGFRGNGRFCEDIDECLLEGTREGHHCRHNTRCVNVPGSYRCECLPGFERQDLFNCVDFDECQAKEHTCHAKALCVNAPGSYKCQCLPGYRGNGFTCDPVCNETCVNGGKCVAPDTCSCRRGYKGAHCNNDIDECELGTHQCAANSKCVNMPGWYYCQCREGFQSKTIDGGEEGYGTVCEDINECTTGRHTCHESAKCVNDDGAFHCDCNGQNGENSTSISTSSCSYKCVDNGLERFDGQSWTSELNSCSRCSCRKGVVTCQAKICNCDDAQVDLECCPQCDISTRCHHQDEYKVTYKSGQTWIYQCQHCECMFGEVDCWDPECPPVSCSNPVRKEGDCCPRCEDDPCDWPARPASNSSNEGSNEVANSGCMYLGRSYRLGQQIPLENDACAYCKCKNGRLCCTYSPTCISREHDASAVFHNRVERHALPASPRDLSPKAGERLLIGSDQGQRDPQHRGLDANQEAEAWDSLSQRLNKIANQKQDQKRASDVGLKEEEEEEGKSAQATRRRLQG